MIGKAFEQTFKLEIALLSCERQQLAHVKGAAFRVVGDERTLAFDPAYDVGVNPAFILLAIDKKIVLRLKYRGNPQGGAPISLCK